MSLWQAGRTTTRSLAAVRRVSCYAAIRSLHSVQPPRIPAPRPTQFTQRSYATPPPQEQHSDLPIQQYHQYSDATMERMLEALENLLDEVSDTSYEVEYASGVLTLKLGNKGTYVINKQPPNKQIWLASPFSGPKRYDYLPEQDEWVYSRDARSLNDLLNGELSDVLSRTVDLDLSNVSKYVS